MAFITRKITRTSQPQELVGIQVPAYSVYLPIADIGYNIVTNTPAIPHYSGRPIIKAGLYGTYADSTNTGVYDDVTAFAINTSNKDVIFTTNFLYTSGYNNFLGSGPNTEVGIAVSSSGAIVVNVGTGNAPTIDGLVTPGVHTICVEITSASADREVLVWLDGTLVNSFASYMYTLYKHVQPRTYGSNIHNTNNHTYVCACIINKGNARELSTNPWQIFEPIEETIWIPDGVSVTLPTLVQPASTTSAGAWTPTGAATLHEAIDEATYSDADYISVAAASTCELVLAESAFPTGNVSLAYRALSSTASTLTVTLKQGATTIMTRTHALTGTATLYTQALTAGEVAAIVAGPITCTLTSS